MIKLSRAKNNGFVFKRILAFLLCISMFLPIIPKITFENAHAVYTTQNEALDKLVQWGIMRGDQAGNLSPNRAITRAEFVTMLNRTFGYTKTGNQPFKDVAKNNWYFDDISIAYNAGYFSGTGNNQASPNSTLTREAAVVMLARNIMLKEEAGEDLAFSDSRDASSWSRGYIKAAAEKGIVSGDPQGTFRPKANITRGEVAILLTRVIGTPVTQEGTYSNNTAGNLMVSKSGVTLENMTITGDLYITGGVGLGYVTLNNVNVYGKIIASGAGESNKGDCSIIIKNSSAPEMIVDSVSNQYVTIRTMGSTNIAKTYVRTNAYLEDKTSSGYGMKYIEIDGEDGTQLDLAGNINEVVSMTPQSAINVGSGTVSKMTIDESAVQSTVTIAHGAVVDTLNLDTGTTVNGKGDINSLYVNAPDSKVEMLPDYIYIRPGITASINGTIMDSSTAKEMSDSPRILTGYPRSDDIGPTQATVKFQTNKSGTLYWAIRLSGDGAMVADDLISPPSYGAKIIKNGKLAISDAKTTVETKITGLSIDTSYVVSAVLVDSKGNKSIVKSLYFTTPDNSKPDFSSGYPKTSTIEDTYVNFDVAASKNSTLYWAIYKKGMTAPTANDFKDNSLSGAIDSGTLKMIKSQEDTITMGNILSTAKNALKELTEYDVYFFLTDTINDSAVKKVSIKTADRTPPEFLSNYPRISKIAAKALTGEAAINEAGKIYWALVKHGTEYPLTNPTLNTPEEILLDQKIQIKGGMYALASGSVTGKMNTPVNINFSGLEAEMAYDIYFVAEDSYGNLSDIATIKNAKTLDNTAPTLVDQKFTQTNSEGVPLADTDITLVFSEDIYSSQTRLSLYEMYNKITSSQSDDFYIYGGSEKISFSDVINNMFTLRNLDIADPKQQIVNLNLGAEDFKRYISVSLTDEGLTELTFKHEALRLLSGTNYQFTLNYVADSSNNVMGRDTKAKAFKTLDAQIDLNQLTVTTIDGQNIDTSFSMIPYSNSTANASAEARYDILIASDTTISFEVYRRERKDNSQWELVKDQNKNSEFSITHTSGDWTALSLNHAQGLTVDSYNKVQDFATNGYEYAIRLKSINLITDSNKWNATVNLKIFCASGSPSALYNLSQGGAISSTAWTNAINAQKVASIGNPADFPLEIVRVNQTAPQFVATYPRAYPGDSVTKIQFQLDREGQLYYVVAPSGLLTPTYASSKPSDAEKDIGNPGDNNWDYLPNGIRDHKVATPTTNNIMNPSNYAESDGYRSGVINYSGTGVSSFNVNNLSANKEYYIYFVLKGSYKDPSPVMVYKFNTADVVPPVLTARSEGSSASYTIKPGNNQENVEAEVYWKLFPYSTNNYPSIFDKQLSDGTTILQAIKKGTFDTLADSALKEEVWQTLTAATSGAVTASQSGNSIDSADSTGKIVSIVDPAKLEKNTDYVLFVAAKNTLGGKPVFAVVDDIHRYEIVGPLISSMSLGENNASEPDKYFSGTLTIQFDKALYVKENGVSTPYKYLTRNDDLTANVYDSVKSSANFSKEYAPVETILNIKLTNFQKGDTLQVMPLKYSKNSLYAQDVDVLPYFCSDSGISRQDLVVVRLTRVKDPNNNNGDMIWTAVISGGKYDGQASET